MGAEDISKILASRKRLLEGMPQIPPWKAEVEGGCGVIGIISTLPIEGKHLLKPLLQMHNRGNGKGGGIAAIGLSPEQLGVSKKVLEQDYLILIAYLDPQARREVEEKYIYPYLRVDKAEKFPSLQDYREVEGLEMEPPEVWRYFCRVKEEALKAFIEGNGLEGLDRRRVEDEFIYQNSFQLNKEFYSSLGEKRAFVLSHGKNMIVLKIVGYAEQLMKYYRLEDFKAYIWIGHQRYPTKGRVWHPGGAHPFIGLNEALVHNGDFANYYSVCEYLRQRNIYPLFLTDTEVSVLLFDLWSRIYQYPLEYLIEALAPTTERDFEMLPQEKKEVYRAIQASHIHGSPDGPWFFIIGRNDPYGGGMQLIGITDTSMLRPQVFALQEGEVKIGLIASEKQAIDAALESLSMEDGRFCPIADKYWNARGGSHTDGGAFIFTLVDGVEGLQKDLICTDKFGEVITTVKNPSTPTQVEVGGVTRQDLLDLLRKGGPEEVFTKVIGEIRDWSYKAFDRFCKDLASLADQGDGGRLFVIGVLTLLRDRRYDLGAKRRSLILQRIDEELYRVFASIPSLGSEGEGPLSSIGWDDRSLLRRPIDGEGILVIDALGFPPEGDEGLASFIVKAYEKGWRRFTLYNLHGQRFCGCGLGANTDDVHIEVYGSSGDYLASGIDGATIIVHGNGQDQVGQILKRGKLVIYGDVGQTFMYGAKGGEVYVLGNTAGRPLINAVGRPRVVINGTSLDYLAESFMAGDPLKGGGFVILNGVYFDDYGKLMEMDTPYPGGNLFSLASGGAIYLRDPKGVVGEDQLNGGRFTAFTQRDWELILPYLQENERLFGITVKDLLTVNGEVKKPSEVYGKIEAIKLETLSPISPHI